VNPLEVSGLFNSLMRLHDALVNFDHENLSRAVELLDVDFERVNFARSELGARNQTIDTIKSQLEDETVQLKSNLSDVIDTDLPAAIAELAGRQAALQASLQLTAVIFQSSLVDYI
jgi:flagellar hook-associated protein 3 FlgL